ncbi:MAG: histidine phosphatase family protein [Actinophytocola sp.]|nr:histidine phosphatase family protein [Actinophytocola sp.]
MTDRRLVILRHAKSGWPEGVSDIERPLAERGERDAPAAGRWLAENLGTIDMALCSPATRARETWTLAAGELAATPDTRYDDRIYDASPGDLLAVVQDIDDDVETAVLIGHNPGLSQLVTALAGEPHELKTSGIVVLTWSGDWTDAGSVPVTLTETTKPRG